MVEHINRRTICALAAVSLLSACSRATYAVQFDADAAAVSQVIEAVRAFARVHGYAMQDYSEPSRLQLNYEGRWSIFWFYRMETGPFRAEFRHRDEVLFPRDDLEAWLAALRADLRQIEGVRFAQAYE